MDPTKLEDWRDVVIIASGSLLILVLLAVFIFTVVLGLATRSTMGTARRMLKTEVTPLLDNVNQTVHSVRGTTAFIGETAVTPIIRVYGIVAGARRAIAVLGGMVSKRQRQ